MGKNKIILNRSYNHIKIHASYDIRCMYFNTVVLIVLFEGLFQYYKDKCILQCIMREFKKVAKTLLATNPSCSRLSFLDFFAC